MMDEGLEGSHMGNKVVVDAGRRDAGWLSPHEMGFGGGGSSGLESSRV